MAAKPPRMAGVNHAAGIFADMSVDGPAIGTLVAIVDRAKNLPNRKTMGKQNPYCAARLGKEAKKTDTDLRGGQTPKWDQELRFTVHESPDYFRLKLSVFNDDKRTDLIGETWIDLKDLIIPGGSQSDQWHPLQFRGKYAGEIRLEMTYYDTRPEDEAVIERRTQGVERSAVKASPSAPAPVSTPSSSSSLSGPRQLKEVKRRPLPTDPTGSAPRPAPEKPHSAPAPVPVPAHSSRPAQYDSVPTPPSSSGVDYTHQPRHTAPPDAHYDMPHGLPSPAARPRTYETPDDFQRDWNVPAPAPAPAPVHHAPPPTGPPKRHPQAYPQEQHYPPYRERAEPQDYHRPRSGYDNAPPADYRSMRQDLPAGRHEPYHEPESREPVYEAPRPSSRHYNQQYPAQDQYSYGPEEPQPLRYHMATGSMSGRRRIDYPQEEVERDRHYRAHSNSIPMRGRSPGRSPGHHSGRDYHAEYAAMQPRVEDEDEEGPPPPPPVHRSGLVQASQQLVPSPAHSYQAYSPEYGPRTTQDMNLPQPTHLTLEEDRFQDLPLVTDGPSMPPSLVSGLDPVIAEMESDRVIKEGEARRRSGIFEDEFPVARSRELSPIPYPADSPSVEDRRRSLVTRKSLNGESPSQQLVLRKSVSPRPPPSRGRANSHISSQTPFSPDSFDAYNPHAARSAVSRDPAPAYDTPAEAMVIARRNEAAASRPDGPIIGDDGREIDPSDHLPTDTWAPEPDRKPRKPGVIVRFKNAPPRAAPRTSPAPPPKEYTSRPTPSYTTDTRGEYSRGRQGYGGSSPGHTRTYSTPSPQPQSRRNSVSPSPSPMYAPANIGPPIPAKVPISAPAGYAQDPLSRELNSIDIGSVGFSSSRAMRKYVPKTITGYAM
ncbi:hypothetical protein BJX63DRAFT_396867 [Aspergillus granulosus]|uniref:C2 domain-containing protein n=1 Tax=Aspergillus granulosus TaxID=176169 RepID=A0ABR4HAB0_9EURO